jgi:hypothetical protein
MHKLIAALIVLGSSVSAQTDITTLSEKEQTLHRWGYCITAAMSVPFAGDLDQRDIVSISNLLDDNERNSSETDPNDIYRKSKQDTAALLITEQLVVDQSLLDSCNTDMKKILANTYVPHFQYLGE